MSAISKARRLVPDSLRRRLAEWICDEYARIYDRRAATTWLDNTFWLGTPVQKLPADLWIYQELLYDTRPELIIETGTMHGGSARFLASIFDEIGAGEIVTIDIEHRDGRPRDDRIQYITASSTDPTVVAAMHERARDRRTMVILDSDHSCHHVLDELAAYAGLVTPGCYLIVEDTAINGHPAMPNWGPGPHEALEQFLPDPRFEVDHGCEKFIHTSHPGGYLRRTEAAVGRRKSSSSS